MFDKTGWDQSLFTFRFRHSKSYFCIALKVILLLFMCIFITLYLNWSYRIISFHFIQYISKRNSLSIQIFSIHIFSNECYIQTIQKSFLSFFSIKASLASDVYVSIRPTGISFREKHLLLTVIEFPALCKTETHENAMFKFGKESVLDSKVESTSKLNHSKWFSSWSFSLLLWEWRKVKGILTCCQSTQQLRTIQNTNE